ncbi:zinc ribbon domain-containing protein [Acetonema longum]|uniref:DZANK-type domain-containing protein n=1 Tax=Acetonema longum DSM 6540 TaxID=1009370 RepID=F7NEH7_9FIRM|nr:zinc ribbon domain-containing protein [Acetonema longum]EGO65388.1 hypothetical protein ALO_02201 [Acetonema longum DSM 6540]
MSPIISFIILALAAYWVYNDSREKGNDFWTSLLWAFGTFAFLIITLPLYLIFGRKRKVQPAAQPEVIDVESVPVEERMICPMCGGTVKEDFVVCPYCANTLKPKCASCGAELQREWRECPNCNAPAPEK